MLRPGSYNPTAHGALPMIDGNRDEAQEYAGAGPAFAALGRFGPIDWARWRGSADRLSRALEATADQRQRIHHLYLPEGCSIIAFEGLGHVAQLQGVPQGAKLPITEATIKKLDGVKDVRNLLQVVPK